MSVKPNHYDAELPRTAIDLTRIKDKREMGLSLQWATSVTVEHNGHTL